MSRSPFVDLEILGETLGVILRPCRGFYGAFVFSSLNPEFENVVGYALSRVNDMNCELWNIDRIVSVIKASPRPLVLRVSSESAHKLESTADLLQDPRKRKYMQYIIPNLANDDRFDEDDVTLFSYLCASSKYNLQNDSDRCIRENGISKLDSHFFNSFFDSNYGREMRGYFFYSPNFQFMLYNDILCKRSWCIVWYFFLSTLMTEYFVHDDLYGMSDNIQIDLWKFVSKEIQGSCDIPNMNKMERNDWMERILFPLFQESIYYDMLVCGDKLSFSSIGSSHFPLPNGIFLHRIPRTQYTCPSKQDSAKICGFGYCFENSKFVTNAPHFFYSVPHNANDMSNIDGECISSDIYNSITRIILPALLSNRMNDFDKVTNVCMGALSHLDGTDIFWTAIYWVQYKNDESKIIFRESRSIENKPFLELASKMFNSSNPATNVASHEHSSIHSLFRIPSQFWPKVIHQNELENFTGYLFFSDVDCNDFLRSSLVKLFFNNKLNEVNDDEVMGAIQSQLDSCAAMTCASKESDFIHRYSWMISHVLTNRQIANILLALVLECNVVLISKQCNSILFVILQWFRYVLQPLKWCHVYASILDASTLMQILDCPTPFIVGSSTFPDSMLSMKTIHVDIDQKKSKFFSLGDLHDEFDHCSSILSELFAIATTFSLERMDRVSLESQENYAGEHLFDAASKVVRDLVKPLSVSSWMTEDDFHDQAVVVNSRIYCSSYKYQSNLLSQSLLIQFISTQMVSDYVIRSHLSMKLQG